MPSATPVPAAELSSGSLTSRSSTTTRPRVSSPSTSSPACRDPGQASAAMRCTGIIKRLAGGPATRSADPALRRDIADSRGISAPGLIPITVRGQAMVDNRAPTRLIENGCRRCGLVVAFRGPDGLAPEPPAGRVRSGLITRCRPVGSPVVWLVRGATPADPELGMPATVLPADMTKERLMAAVMIGADPHKGSHTAVAISLAEEPLGELDGTSARDVGEVHWLLFWPEAPAGNPCWPDATEAAEALMAACIRQLEDWGVTRQHAGGELPVRGVYGCLSSGRTSARSTSAPGSLITGTLRSSTWPGSMTCPARPQFPSRGWRCAGRPG